MKFRYFFCSGCFCIVCFSLLAVNGSDSHSYSLLVIENIIKRFIWAFQKENSNFSNCTPPTSHIPCDLQIHPYFSSLRAASNTPPRKCNFRGGVLRLRAGYIFQI